MLPMVAAVYMVSGLALLLSLVMVSLAAAEAKPEGRALQCTVSSLAHNFGDKKV